MFRNISYHTVTLILSVETFYSAPNFTQESTKGTINFHEYIESSWCILFSHPKAFTPICTTELGQCAKMRAEWETRGVKVIAVSLDSAEDNAKWVDDIEELSGAEMFYPILCDTGDHPVCLKYSMLYPDEEVPSMPATVRSVFIIGPDKKIKLTLTYPPPVGRNFEELLRVLDALQLVANKSLGTPANWCSGQKCVILPSVSNEAAQEKHPGFETVKPYLRYTADGVEVEARKN